MEYCIATSWGNRKSHDIKKGMDRAAIPLLVAEYLEEHLQSELDSSGDVALAPGVAKISV